MKQERGKPQIEEQKAKQKQKSKQKQNKISHRELLVGKGVGCAGRRKASKDSLPPAAKPQPNPPH